MTQPDSERPTALLEVAAQALLTRSSVGVLLLDSHGVLIWQNQAMRQLVGLEGGQASPTLGQELAGLPNIKAAGGSEPLRALIERRVPCKFQLPAVTSLVGETFAMAMEGIPLKGGGAVIAVTDIAAQVALQDRLQEAPKLAFLGTMMGGIAHELNNLLVGVRSNASLLLSRLREADQNHGTAQRLDRATARLSAVVDGLLTLARGDRAHSADLIDLGAIISGLDEILVQQLPRQVTLEMPQLTAPLPVRISVAHAEQIIVNLVLNAANAIASSGADGWVQVQPHADETHIYIDVIDNGPGVPERIRDRVFSPFFTSRPRGTGLGLAVSRTLAEAHGGSLTLRETTAGANFRLTLARASRPEPPPRHSPIRMLVVEDNVVVAILVEEILSRAGYEVVMAASLAEARAAGPADLLLCDVDLPDGHGVDLALELGIPAVMMSGSPLSEADRAQLPAATAFVRKPFDVTTLLAAIEQKPA